MKVLLTGWFSFPGMGASAGDMITADLVERWLDQAGIAVDRAVAEPFARGVDWRSASPGEYTHVLFVCGPFGNGPPLVEFLDRFRNTPLVGLNLTMLEDLEAWNPFQLLIERDSSRAAHPDFAFAAPPPTTPVVGVVLIDAQPEYGDHDGRLDADELIEGLLQRRSVAIVPIDTRLDVQNRGGLRSAEEIEAVIARMDLVITTRLHGAVLALKNGVPVLALDSVRGGAKVLRQMQTIDWPWRFEVSSVSTDALDEAFDQLLRPEAQAAARRVAERSTAQVETSGALLVEWLTGRDRP